jgi:hypothetical protein
MCPKKWRMRDYGHIKGINVPEKVENVGLWSHKRWFICPKKSRSRDYGHIKGVNVPEKE